MSFLKTLFFLMAFPAVVAAVFPGNSEAGRAVKIFLNKYPYYILLSEKTRLNSLLFKLFSKTNNRRPFIYYTRIAYFVFAILQIPIAVIINYLEVNILDFYVWIVIAICIIPYILLIILTWILERKEKAYKKQHK